MPLDPQLRARQRSEQIAPAMSAILGGAFGSGSLAFPPAVNAVIQNGALYHFHEGDVFFPQSPSYVFEPLFENPIVTMWGQAFLRKANTFKPVSAVPQVYAYPNIVTRGIGGLQAGELALQPLVDPNFINDSIAVTG